MVFDSVAGYAADEPANEPAAGRHGHARPHRRLPAAPLPIRARSRHGKLVIPQSPTQLHHESQPAATATQ